MHEIRSRESCRFIPSRGSVGQVITEIIGFPIWLTTKAPGRTSRGQSANYEASLFATWQNGRRRLTTSPMSSKPKPPETRYA
jgi:hypothetical protein